MGERAIREKESSSAQKPQNKGTSTWRQSLESIRQFCTISPSALFGLNYGLVQQGQEDNVGALNQSGLHIQMCTVINLHCILGHLGGLLGQFSRGETTGLVGRSAGPACR